MEPVITAADRREFARARAAWHREEMAPGALVRARYDGRRDAVNLTFRCDATIVIPRRLIRWFDGASKADLRAIKVFTYDGIECKPIDMHIFVPGLIEEVFGTRFLAAAMGRRGGQRRSRLKAAAARANGALGGRPRKKTT